MKPGIYNIPAADYHADSAISIGSLSKIARCPAYWRWTAREETRPMAVGDAAHCAILEPQRFADAYRRHEGKGGPASAAFAAAQALIPAALLAPEEWDLVQRAREAAWENPELSGYLLDDLGEVERSAYWIDPSTCTACKCRPDFTRPGVMIDLKLVKDASPRAFVRDCADYAHHARAAWYLDGWRAAGGWLVDRYIFALVDKSFLTGGYAGPLAAAAALYELSPKDVEKGRRYYRRALDRYLECLEYDAWPGYPAGVTTVDLPDWSSF
jgi:hypothetical protein